MKKIWNSKTELFFTIEPSFFYRFHIILTITSVFQTIIFSIFSKNWFIVRRKDREHNAKIFLWEINTMQNNLWWKQQKRWQSQIGYNIINYELNRQMLAEEVILWEFMMDLCKSKTQHKIYPLHKKSSSAKCKLMLFMCHRNVWRWWIRQVVFNLSSFITFCVFWVVVSAVLMIYTSDCWIV